MFGLSSDTVAMLGSWAVKIVGALVGLFAANIVASIARNAINRQLSRTKFDPTLTRFFANMARYAVLTLAVLAVLGIFGVETTSVAAVIGGASLAVGLAFQGSLGNFAAGVMLLVFRPFKVADFIKVAGVSGTVDTINLFSTTLDTLDHRRLIVPNGSVFGATIENMTFRPVRRVDINVGVAYGADIDATRAVLENAAASVPDQPEGHAWQVFLVGLGGSSVDWQLRIWCHNPGYWDTHEATVRAIKYGLDAAEIGIPYPTMDLNVTNVG